MIFSIQIHNESVYWFMVVSFGEGSAKVRGEFGEKTHNESGYF